MKLDEVKKIIDKVTELLDCYVDDDSDVTKEDIRKDGLEPLLKAASGLDEILWVLEDII